MEQMISITKARSTLSSLVKQVVKTKKPIVIIQDSTPSVVIIPYEKPYDPQEYKKKLLAIKGHWYIEEDYKKIREEIEEQLSKNGL